MSLVALVAMWPTGPIAAPIILTEQQDAPFGLQTHPAPEGVLWTRWRRLQADLRNEADALATCRSGPRRCTPAAARLLALIDDARVHPLRARIAVVNREVNRAVRWDASIAAHGMPERWMPPLASFTSGRGDCMGIAIAKYVALRHADVPAASVRLLIVWDRSARVHHAVVAASSDGRWLILDNRTAALLEDRDWSRVAPKFSIDHTGVWQFQPARPFKLKDMLPGAA